MRSFFLGSSCSVPLTPAGISRACTYRSPKGNIANPQGFISRLLIKKPIAFAIGFFMSKPVSRVLSFKTVIYLRRTFLHGSSHLSDIGRTNPPCGILSMLHRVGFTEPSESPPKRWSLTPPFHPYRKIAAVYFCCTFLKVAFTGSYPAPCPVELGLSSLTLSCPRDRSACSKCIILYP